MKKLLTLMLGSALVLAACGGEEPEDDVDTGDDMEEATEEVEEVAYDAGRAEELYEQSCIGCHGGDLEGTSGPPITGLSEEEVLNAIEEGPGIMQSNILEGEEAELVSQWAADQ
ncbi:c-type cytochrome [Texcoconibacillus texcoconensis]|uniref:Mono/diheme cytochrome c family protein n=1 Tax=Texcoconibacillus texcoconensis TaxID=1095777 RepID=A0A840QPX1_9BACI|nr:mono/diheme cytochrome c family protein [Texcoconibacillus texcoconensis]